MEQFWLRINKGSSEFRMSTKELKTADGAKEPPLGFAKIVKYRKAGNKQLSDSPTPSAVKNPDGG